VTNEKLLAVNLSLNHEAKQECQQCKPCSSCLPWSVGKCSHM